MAGARPSGSATGNEAKVSRATARLTAAGDPVPWRQPPWGAIE
jgi:hypothetical protein